MLIIYFALAAVALWAIGAVSHMIRCHEKHCRCSLPQRYFSGRSLNGHRVWDSTFWREGTKTLPGVVDASPFQRLPGWERRAWRALPLAAAVAGLVSCARSSYQRAWLALAVGCAAVLLAVVALRFLRRTKSGRRLLGRLRRHRSGRVEPMSQKMATITGTSPHSLKDGIKWSPDYANTKPGDVVATWTGWPHDFKASGKERAAIQDLWTARLGFALVFAWHTDIDQPELVMKRAFELPPIVYLHEVLEKVEALPEDKTAIGVDDRGNLVCWDWGSEAPHGLLNAGSRHGKTETEEGMVCQVLRKGGKTTYVDVKRTSIQGLKGLPDLRLLDNPRDMAGMWLAIAEWGADLDDRIDARTKDPTVEFCRDLLVLEEVNQFSEMCDEFWENLPEEDEDWIGTVLWKPKHAKRTPAIWRVIKHGVWEGAFVKKNVLIAGQNIEAQTVKGVRNSIGMRLLGGYQPQNWKALVGTTPIPPAPPHRGRWCLINGSTQTWVQALIADKDPIASAAIWRDYARAGRKLDGTPGAAYEVDLAGQVSLVSDIGSEVSSQRSDLHGYPGVLASLGQPPATGPATLEELVDSGVILTTLTAAQRRSTRDDDHPQPVGRRGNAHLYDTGQMRAYELSKSRVRAR